jgi:macrodomain Ter protein organizer (MatP/YcbG family)
MKSIKLKYELWKKIKVKATELDMTIGEIIELCFDKRYKDK